MRQPARSHLRRRAVASALAALLGAGVLSASVSTPARAAAPDPDVTITPVAGGYEVTLDLDAPLPIVSDAPTLLADGVDLGPVVESADGLSLSVITSDDSVLGAEITSGWSSGRDKVEAFDAPVTDDPARPVAPVSQKAVEELAAKDGSDPGPFAYTVDDYDFGDQAIDLVNMGGIKGELTGRIYLPTTTGPSPVVILLHGRHTSCSTLVAGTQNPNRWPCVTGQTEVPSYKGYDGTGQTLATHGYAVVSISANAINANDNQLATLDLGATARGQLVLDSLDLLKEANAGQPAARYDAALDQTLTLDQALDAPQVDVGTTDPNALDATDLVGRFDFTNIGVMGHSRGGEGATAAVALNQALETPYGITSVLPLAPVDFTRMTVADTPMLVMLPYCDGDVSNQQGQHFIDDSRNAFSDDVLLSTVWVMGANHNFFNTVWTPGKYPFSVSDDWGATSTDAVCGPRAATNIRLSADEQYDVGTAYMSAWFRLSMSDGAEDDFLPMFDGSVKPALESVPTADIRVLASAPASERADIERFDTFTGKVLPFGTATPVLCANASGRTLPQPLPVCATTNTLRSTSAMPHWTPASRAPNAIASPMTRFLWTRTTGTTAASIRIAVPPAARSASDFDALVFKTAPDEAVTTGTDFTVTVVDGAGASWSTLASTINPLAVRRMPTSNSTTLNKIVLQEVSIPVDSMTGINTGDIREIRFTAQIGADGTETGGAYLSDLGLANAAVGAPSGAPLPTIGVDATIVEEGSTIGTADMAVYLSEPSDAPVIGAFTLNGSTASTSKAGPAVQDVTFAPGETCVPVTIQTLGDSTATTSNGASYTAGISWNRGAIFGPKTLDFLSIREDDAVVSPGVAIAPVGVQGDVCAEFAAKSQVNALTSSNLEPAPGDTVTLSGTGFRDGESVSFASGEDLVEVGTSIAGPDGAVTLELPIDEATPLGILSITATGFGSGRVSSVDLSVLATTTTALTISPEVPLLKQATTLTATVTGDDTAGSVDFVDGSTALGSAPVTDGIAVLELPAGFGAGPHSVSAAFAKTATANSSVSETISFTLVEPTPPPVDGGPPVKTQSTIMLTLSTVETVYGTGATGTVVVGGAGPGDQVSAKVGSTTTTLALDGTGRATFPLAADLAAGVYPVLVTYGGSDTVAAAVPATTSYLVTKAGSTTKAKAKSKVKSGKKVKVRTRVLGLPGVELPSGKVNFKVGSKVVKRVRLSSGRATARIRLTGKGPKTVKVLYRGDSNYKVSKDLVTVVVKKKK